MELRQEVLVFLLFITENHMAKVSIIIPARGEKPENVSRTLKSIYENATGEFEIIVGFDGKESYQMINCVEYYPNTQYIEFPSLVGIKTNINALASMATGKYIYKSDAHCKFGKGFDEILQRDMQPDWIVMPRFYILKGDTWTRQERDGELEFYDYFYLCCPFTDPRGFRFKAGGHWKERTKERDPNIVSSAGNELRRKIDETPQIHGSGWFMERDHYFRLGGFPNVDPHGHAQEPIWLALKNWLMGGQVVVNKNTWYAHMHQQGNKRGYHMDRAQESLSYKIAADHFVGDRGNYLYSFDWFVDKFMPMPTWPDNWKELLHNWEVVNK